MEEIENGEVSVDFKPILEDLRQLICEKDVRSEEELIQMISLISIIGVEQLNLEDITSILNVVLSFCKDNTQKFPSFALLEFIKTCLEFLRQGEHKLNIVPFSWPFNLRLLIRRFFQTFKIDEEYIVYAYELASLAARALGIHWLQTDPQFSTLMASLASGRLRIVMENAETVKMAELIACLSILEDFIRCIEDDDDDLLNDVDATSIGTSCQQAAVYVIECVLAINEQDSSNKDNIYRVLFHYLSVFLAIDGAKILDAKIREEAKPILLNICSTNGENFGLYEPIFKDLF